MRKLLQNKFVVGALAAVAVGCVSWDFIAPKLRRPVPVEARSTETPPALPEPMFTNYGPLRIADRLANWRDLFTRDIVRASLFTYPNAGESNGPVAMPPPTAQQAPSVQAISIDGDRSLAVIAGRVVAEGELIGDFHVEKILPREVWFQHQGRRVIQPWGSVPSSKNTSALSPAADLPRSSRPLPLESRTTKDL